MNWYSVVKTSKNKKQFKKLLAQKTYIDYFHKDHKDGEYLWLVDENFRFYKKQTGKEFTGHADWAKYESNNILASGRFGFQRGKVLATMVIYFTGNPTKQSYIRNRVEEILNQELDYPTIKEFS